MIGILFGCLNAMGQTQSDVNVSESGYGLVKTNITVDYGHGWGAVQDCFATRVSYEFLRNKKFTVTANARYTSTEVSYTDNDLNSGFSPNEIGLNGTHIMVQAGVTSTFRTRLFGKPFAAMAMVNSEWSNGFARVSGIAMGMIMLRANQNTQFGLGPLVMVNTCSKMPAFLVFMYRHKFNDKWLINLYGGMFGVDYTPTRKDLISIGADIDVKAFYFKPQNELLPIKCRYTATSLRPMAKYKRRLVDNLYFSLQCGMMVKMSCRITGTCSSKELIDCHNKIAPFVQVGASYSL